MIYNKSRLLALGVICVSLSFINTNANAEIRKTEINEETLQNVVLLANENSNKVNTKSDYKIKNNWLTDEVAKQLNKNIKDLTVEDFERIVKIDFRYKKIDDTIPDEIVLLKNLQYLDLNYCRLYGDIPEGIADMSNLTHLDLGDNRLGKLPEVLEKKIIDGDYDYCDVEGNQIRLASGWHLLKGKWVYIDGYGERLKGVQSINNITYDFGDEGFIKEGWEQKDNLWYYYDRTLGMIKNSWKLINNKWYYFNTDGIMATGLQNINGTKFCLALTGEMLTGFQNIGGYNYYFCESGGMQYGWVNVNGKEYYFDETTGIMAVSTEKIINGKKYIFASDGSSSLNSNIWIDNYHYIQANGQTVNTYYDYSHSNTNYQLFKYMTDLGNQISVDRTAVALHGGITSNNCVYFASEALRRVGVELPIDTCNTYDMENKLKGIGFVPCYDLSQLKPGDIVFTNNYTHVYIFMCWDTDGYAYIVDNQSYNFDNKILHRRQVYKDTPITDRSTHFYYYPN